MKKTIINEDIEYIHRKIKNHGDWDNSTVLITGCAGFLGFYFLHYFVIKGKDLGR